MTTYQRPGGANWRKRGRGIVPTQEPWQQPQRKPGMFTGQQPQAAQPSVLDKKLNPAQYPTLNTSPGVEKTNFGLPPLQGEVPGFDAEVQKRRADAFMAARNAREAEMKKNKVGRKADKRAKKFVDTLRNTPVDPRTFTGGIPDDPTAPKGQEGRLHPLHKGEGDDRQIYRGKYSPEWHHMQQNKQRADQIQKGIDEGRIMRPQSVGLPGYTSGGNFRQPGNQWALGNIKARTANALKAGFQPIMGMVKDGTGQMVEDIIGYEKIGDAQRREAMKAPPGEGKKIQTDPQDNPFTQTPELPGIDNAGGDVNIEPPSTNVGAQGQDFGEKPDLAGEFPTDQLDMPGFNPEPYPVEDLSDGSVSAPSGGVEQVSPFGPPVNSDVDLDGGRGMVIPDLRGVTEPKSPGVAPHPPAGRNPNKVLQQGPAPDTPSPQPPMPAEQPQPNPLSGGPDKGDPNYNAGDAPVTPVPNTENFTGAPQPPMQPDMTDAPPLVFPHQRGGIRPVNREQPEERPMIQPPTLPPTSQLPGTDLPELPEYDVQEGNPFDMQEDIDRQEYEQNPSRQRNPFDIQEGMQNPYSPNYDESQVAPAQGEVPEQEQMLPPIGSQEEADIANPPQDLSGNFPPTMQGVGDKLKEENQEEIGDTGSFQPEHQVPPGVEFNDPADRRPMLPPIGSQDEADIANPQQDLSGNFPQSPSTQPTRSPSVGDFFGAPESPYDLNNIGPTELPPYEPPAYDIELPEAEAQEESALSPEGQEAANELMMQIQDTPEGPELEALIAKLEELKKQDQNRLAPAATEIPWNQRGD